MAPLDINASTGWALAVLLIAMRIGPTIVLAPPFSLIQAPLRVRVAMTLALSACIATPVSPRFAHDGALLVIALATELLLGLAIAFALQAAFAALSLAGRALDVQAGYGLATVILPGSRTQSPLFGSILTLVAGAIFFAENGHLALLQLVARTLDILPPGQVPMLGGPDSFIRYLGVVMTLGFVATLAITLTLFLIDITIAFLSRALPQMNALLLGLQVKTIATLTVLAMSAGLLGPATLRLMHASLDFVFSLA
ncbi:flagellar biosynthetic protein FliR [Burkholderia sp. BCC1977]|uniref:flagellar biosynthetic protein FliR n=1 Tax=Burkholderia sp. BCC1977 TaxID=2817440 RepID=UPI002ABE137D|nr:flagellar biosynthetic protein FliR [Burkholderia sp. BCC1977]